MSYYSTINFFAREPLTSLKYLAYIIIYNMYDCDNVWKCSHCCYFKMFSKNKFASLKLWMSCKCLLCNSGYLADCLYPRILITIRGFLYSKLEYESNLRAHLHSNSARKSDNQCFVMGFPVGCRGSRAWSMFWKQYMLMPFAQLHAKMTSTAERSP